MSIPARTSTSFIVIRCSATRPNMDVGAKEIRKWHLNNGWSDIGYHWVIRRNGNFKVQFCQASGAAGSITMEAGAYLEYMEVV